MRLNDLAPETGQKKNKKQNFDQSASKKVLNFILEKINKIIEGGKHGSVLVSDKFSATFSLSTDNPVYRYFR